MPDLVGYADIEVAVMALLANLSSTGTATPPDLTEPFTRVTRFGGGDDLVTDTARVDIDSFAPTRTGAFTLAEATRQRLINFPHVVSGCVIDRVTTDTGPHLVPWTNTKPFRFTAAYTVTARRPN